ncbi:MAG: AmmeMemoRadiSam system protein A [Spirochaetes bacterium]|nr:AmmeMemoRadiSam system protein A [Spirochaetota bacterium]
MLEITGEEKKELLEIARESVESRLRGTQTRFMPGTGSLAARCGAFVTLSIGRNLRGCIGRISATTALAETVRIMAAAAAFEDSRFPPVSPGEWPSISIEISVLTPLSACPDPGTVEVGRHGLYIVRGFQSGVLLPQVPVEWGWDRVAFLKQVCRKACLPEEAWQSPATELYTFEAIVFGEKD